MQASTVGRVHPRKSRHENAERATHTGSESEEEEEEESDAGVMDGAAEVAVEEEGAEAVPTSARSSGIPAGQVQHADEAAESDSSESENYSSAVESDGGLLRVIAQQESPARQAEVSFGSDISPEHKAKEK